VGAKSNRSRARELGPFLGLAAVVVALDQASKALIRAWLREGEAWPGDFELIRLVHVENSGAAFGILQGAGVFLVVTTVIGIAAILGYLVFAPTMGRWYSAALGLVLGGALGNFADRLARGTVTDFIDPTHYPAFNLADSAIVVGVATLFVLSMFERDHDRERERASPSAAAATAEVDGAPR
jgi:signal peptidase II